MKPQELLAEAKEKLMALTQSDSEHFTYKFIFTSDKLGIFEIHNLITKQVKEYKFQLEVCDMSISITIPDFSYVPISFNSYIRNGLHGILEDVMQLFSERLIWLSNTIAETDLNEKS